MVEGTKGFSSERIKLGGADFWSVLRKASSGLSNDSTPSDTQSNPTRELLKENAIVRKFIKMFLKTVSSLPFCLELER